jgi:hypothetical protein
MSQLLPCPSCARHVRQTEAGCPFCGASLSLADAPARALPTRRLGRAATFAFGAVIVMSVSACGGTSNPGNDSGIAPAYGAPADSGMMNDSGMLAMYGGPPQDAGSDTGGPGPLYGAPAFDAGDDGGGPAPAYGAVPAPDAAT